MVCVRGANAYTLVFIGSVDWIDEPSFLGGWFSAMVKDIEGSKEFRKGLTRCTPASKLGKGSLAQIVCIRRRVLVVETTEDAALNLR